MGITGYAAMTKIIIGIMLGVVIIYLVLAFIHVGGFPSLYTNLVTTLTTSGFKAETSFENFSMALGLFVAIGMGCLMWYELVLNT